MLDNIEIPQIDNNIDFFGNQDSEFESKKVEYENKNNVSNEVLSEFNKLNNNVRINNKEKFNFFSDAEENDN